jgi:23S rRNA (uracil1939-C5)-methyltransferase
MDVTITSLGGLGNGIGEHNGKPVFVAKSLPGDRIKVRIVHENRDGLHGQISEIISPSPDRNIPPCPYYDRCGGCALQHLKTDHYHSFKTNILHNALTRAGFHGDNYKVIFLPANSRRRVEFKIDHSAFPPTLCFYEERSHTPVPITSCYILHPELSALIPHINRLLASANGLEKLYAIGLTLVAGQIDILMTFRDQTPANMDRITSWCSEHNIARLSLKTRDSEPTVHIEKEPYIIPLYGYNIPIPPNAFLQASMEGQDTLTHAVLEACKTSKSVADLFCGIGSYSIPLSRYASVHAVEGDEAMITNLQNATVQYKIPGFSCEKRDLFKSPLSPQELKRFDSVILNPPRVGAKAQCEMLVQSSVNHVVMVSCNPASFARDASILQKAGFGLDTAFGMDQFVFSAHLEIVAVFTR